jgi:hypothetical protein
MAVLPPGLALALGPVLEQIAAMTVKIQQYDRTIKRRGVTRQPLECCPVTVTRDA